MMLFVQKKGIIIKSDVSCPEALIAALYLLDDRGNIPLFKRRAKERSGTEGALKGAPS